MSLICFGSYNYTLLFSPNYKIDLYKSGYFLLHPRTGVALLKSQIPSLLSQNHERIEIHGSVRRIERVHRSIIPHLESSSVLISPAAAAPPETAVGDSSVSDDSLRARPLHVLHGGFRDRLRRHSGAPRHWIQPRSVHRGCPPRRVPSGSGQRPVHYRGAVIRIHVSARRHRDCYVGPGVGQEQGQNRQVLVCLRRRHLHCRRLRNDYALYSHQDPWLS